MRAEIRRFRRRLLFLGGVGAGNLSGPWRGGETARPRPSDSLPAGERLLAGQFRRCRSGPGPARLRLPEKNLRRAQGHRHRHPRSGRDGQGRRRGGVGARHRQGRARRHEGRRLHPPRQRFRRRAGMRQRPGPRPRRRLGNPVLPHAPGQPRRQQGRSGRTGAEAGPGRQLGPGAVPPRPSGRAPWQAGD